MRPMKVFKINNKMFIMKTGSYSKNIYQVLFGTTQLQQRLQYDYNKDN